MQNITGGVSKTSISLIYLLFAPEPGTFTINPAALVAVNPCRGLDVGSARFVQERILARRDAGTAVLLISTEIDEVLELSDRVVALVRGRVVAVPAGADRATIGAILLGVQAA